jgi:tRNA1(Val) A37 N6-methylase TrmN6
MIARADAIHLPFKERAFDLVIGSPPYTDARDYLEDGANLGISRDCRAWVDWMLGVTEEALRAPG